MSTKSILILLLLVGGGYFYVTFLGEQADGLVSDIVINRDNKGGHLDINFSNPVRYLGHYPPDEGDVLQVKLRPVAFGGFAENVSLSDKLPSSAKVLDYNIEDIIYEGKVPGGPFIVIRFSKPMRFEIKEGEGLKSLLVSFQHL